MKTSSSWILSLAGLAVAGYVYVALDFSRPSATGSRSFDGSPAGPRPAEMDPGQAAGLGLKTISFVHFNDFHAHYSPHDYAGTVLSPLSLLRGYRDQVKAENPNTVFCSAGDEMEKGSLVDLVSGGAATIEIYRHLGLDLRAVGNHDFAYGLDTLRRFVSEPGGAVLCANQAVAQGFHQFTIDGVRVGVFSMVGQPWDERDQQYEGPYFKGVDCRYDFAAQAREIIQAHRKEVDLLFLLSHLGLELDREVALQAPGLDFIIGGHSHTLLRQPELSASGIPIVQAGSYGEYVGRLDVMVDSKTHRMAGYHYRVTSVTPANMTPNLELECRIREICRRYEPNAEENVASLAEPLSRKGVGKLAAEAAMAVLQADAAVIDLTTVWGGLEAGPVTRQTLLNAFRVEIEPPGTHGFNAMMTATLRAADWEGMRQRSEGTRRTAATDRFVLAERPGASAGRETLRVAIQRRTALRLQKYFPGSPVLASPRFEMETWEVLARHFTSRDTRAAAPAAAPLNP
jgi:2',3'-cyclic-nucleotide 2'-phosphodiesterase (5'-nucleotidase family)